MARWPASILKLLLGVIIVVTLLSSSKEIPPSFNFRSMNASSAEAVSYTHLTLPTKA